MVTSLDGAATVGGRSGGLSGAARPGGVRLLRALADVILVGAGHGQGGELPPGQAAPEGVRWAGCGRAAPPSPPIAVVTRRLGLDLDEPAARRIAGARPHDRHHHRGGATRAAGRGGRHGRGDRRRPGQVDLAAAVGALAGRGHRQILTEGGPYLLSQIIEAGLLDELCLTVSPVLARRAPAGSWPTSGRCTSRGAWTPARSASPTCWPTTGT